MLTVLAMVGCTAWAAGAGDLWKLAAPFDRDGNMCGYKTGEGVDYTERKFLMGSKCVKECGKGFKDLVRVCVPEKMDANKEM